jgi:hypothetical protein
MEYTVRVCDACPRPAAHELPGKGDLTPTDTEGIYLLDEELEPLIVTIGREGEERVHTGMLCPTHVASLNWYLQRDDIAV